jgi:hypothetical protein
VVAAELARDRQRRLEGHRCERLGEIGPKRQQAVPTAPQGQQVGERTAAEGAEESSAPQTG